MEVSEAIIELTKFGIYLRQKAKPTDAPEVKANSDKLIDAVTMGIACCCIVEQLQEKEKGEVKNEPPNKV